MGPTNASTFDRARRVTAADFYDIGTRFPSVFVSSTGSWMTDVEGRQVLDVTAAGGALLLGNRHPQVTEAITAAIRDHGTIYSSTLSIPRIELSEVLARTFPACEKVVYFKSGSEATTAALRLVRQATGRDLVLSAGFHGWFDWQRPYRTFGYHPSIGLINFGYNETVLARLLDRLGDRIAGVFVTPEPAWHELGFYRHLAEQTRDVGACFLLDEVITGFRYGPSGLNGGGGVDADVVTISKGLANGHALAAVMGRREVIDCYDAAGLEGTYTREVPPMAAALATLGALADGSVHAHCELVGSRLRDGAAGLLERCGLQAAVVGPSMMFDIVFPSEEIAWSVYRRAYDHGVWFEDSGTQMVTAAYGDDEVEHALAGLEAAAQAVVAEIGRVEGPLPSARRQEFAANAFGHRPTTVDEGRQLADYIVEQVRRGG